MKNIIILLISLVTSNFNAQDITTTFNIYFDDKKIETDSVYVGIVQSVKMNPRMLKITDNFTTFLAPNTIYKVIITHPGYHKQQLILETHNDKPVTCIINLKKNSEDIHLGNMKYNKILKQYTFY